ncbi:putative serine/threonine-protein kinase [Andrographis paniculata]|uniref:putative serine/threonine-protein kinase n=1 Tax=Andrographis paniculata TaxID=175694 RepID=UPI0021E78C8E|nr:putative serine/threonine-protein kinase [Andrographis paniculata]
MKFGSAFFRCFQNSAATFAAIDTSTIEADEDDGRIPSNRNFSVFTYNELKAATHGFTNKLGEGAFGAVYKGRLSGDGRFIAVKVLTVELESLQKEREFAAEITALSDIRHENLVNLRGCCVDGAQRLLVYDYMENNSLSHTYLGTEQNRAKFTWKLRKTIALGIAKGICHLHEEVNPHIVHRDIKSSNILLDHNSTAKLADFGMAKLFRDGESHISTHVAGTLGYLAPEYAYTGRLTRKSDVYSFGVLLLEIISGQPVVGIHIDYGEQFLVEKAWELHNANNLLELVDCALKGEFSREEAARSLRAGLLCVQESAKRRPTMSDVIKMLSNQIDADSIEISRPGLIANLMEVKIRKKQ